MAKALSLHLQAKVTKLNKNIVSHTLNHCPECGAELYPEDNKLEERISKLLAKFSSSELGVVQVLWGKMKAKKSGNKMAFSIFLSKLRKFNEGQIVGGVNSFMRQNMDKRGKGYTYCLGFVRNWDTSFNKKRKDKDGSVPTIVKFTKETNGNRQANSQMSILSPEGDSKS